MFLPSPLAVLSSAKKDVSPLAAAAADRSETSERSCSTVVARNCSCSQNVATISPCSYVFIVIACQNYFSAAAAPFRERKAAAIITPFLAGSSTLDQYAPAWWEPTDRPTALLKNVFGGVGAYATRIGVAAARAVCTRGKQRCVHV